MDRLSAGQIQQLHTSFLLLDGDGDGRIDAVDLQKFLSTFNADFSLQELESFINDQACHPNGVLDFPEFVNVLSRLICDSLDLAPDIDEEEIRRVYDSWDKDGDGLISANDLREVVASFGEEWSDENVNDMIYYKKSNGTFAFQIILESDENVNDMIYYKKSNGTFAFQDLKDVLLGGRPPAQPAQPKHVNPDSSHGGGAR